MAECSSASTHTPAPSGYLQWHGWAERMAKTHRQLRCRGCRLFKVWVPKGSRAAASGGGGTDG